MLIINRSEIDMFVTKHSNARKPFAQWVQKTQESEWKNFADLKCTFNSADYKSGFVIFNVGGNNYRVQAEVFYDLQQIHIYRIGTHTDYDRWQL